MNIWSLLFWLFVVVVVNWVFIKIDNSRFVPVNCVHSMVSWDGKFWELEPSFRGICFDCGLPMLYDVND
jgi:hypothetical protein